MPDLLISLDPELPAELGRAIEHALHDLAIATADESAIDPDSESPRPFRLVLAATGAAPARTDADTLMVLAGPGVGTAQGGAVQGGAARIEASDIERRTRRWIGLVERLGARLGRPGLAAYVAAQDDAEQLKAWALDWPNDPLAESIAADFDPADLRARLADAHRRADDADTERRDLKRRLADALREKSDAEGQSLDHRRDADDQIVQLDAQLEAARRRIAELEATLESTAYALELAPVASRGAIEAARREAGVARAMADRADAIALDAPDALRWKTASYVGQSRDGQPEGYGVMRFAADRTAGYRGQFVGGQRVGHGVGAVGGLTWSGQWRNDEPEGHGVLEGPGVRYEGEVKPGEHGPRRVKGGGHLWDAAPPAQLLPEKTKAARQPIVMAPAPQLPAPD